MKKIYLGLLWFALATAILLVNTFTDSDNRIAYWACLVISHVYFASKKD